MESRSPGSALQSRGVLEGRVALVTGSARGIGAAIARRLAECGADLAIHCHTSKASALHLASEIRGSGRRAEVFPAGLSEPTAARLLVREVAETFGRLDILVYNVGPFLTRPLIHLTENEWDWIMNTNLKSAWAAECEASHWLKRTGEGRIVNISANSAYIRTHSIYGLAKAALIHLTETLAVEMGPYVTVNCLAPGMVAGSEPDEATAQTVLDRTPTQRLVTREEIAEMCALVCSPAFASVTGRTIVMDGGRWIR